MHKIILIFVFLFASSVMHCGFASDTAIIHEIKDKAEYIQSNNLPVYNVACSMDGKYYAGANETKTITIRETESGKVISKIKRYDNIRAVEFVPSSSLVLIGLFSGTIEVWDIVSGNLIKTFKALGGPISDIAYSDDGKYFVVAGGMGNIRSMGVKIYDASNYKELHFINNGVPYESISIDKNSKKFAVSTWHGIFFYELPSGKLIDHFGEEYSYFDISLSNNASILTFAQNISAGKSYAVVLDLTNERVVLSLLTGVTVSGALLSRDGSMLYVGGDDGVVGIFDMESKKWLNHATSSGGTIKSMSLCGSKYLITGHWYNKVNVIDIFNGNVIRINQGG